MAVTGRRALLLLPALAACAELRTPPAMPGGALGEVPATGPALRATAEATAAAFARQGEGLAGRPAETALALARLEALAMEISDRRTSPSLSPSVAIALRTARNESRAAVGIAASAPAAEVVQALAKVAQRLRAGDRAGAEAALVPGLFDPGGAGTLDRFAAPGPLPAAEQATAALVREIRRLDLSRGWAGAGNWWQAGEPGAITDGLGAGF